MKILLVAENWPPRVGGIEKYLVGMVSGLAKQPNTTITVVAPLHAGQVNIPNVTVISKRFFWPLLRPAWLPTYIFIKRLATKEKFDVVLCGKALFEGLLGYYLKRSLAIPFVVFTYAMEINTWANNPKTKRKLVRVLTTADGVIAINKQTVQTIKELGVASEKISIIYPSVDQGFLAGVAHDQNHSEILKKYGIQKPYILTVARLIERKGIDDVIRAFAQIDQMKFMDIQLVIVGDGPARSQLEKTAAHEYVKPIFVGQVPDTDLPALFTQARVFALTPKAVGGDIEGFGIVYLEAAAAGTPVIASNSGGVPEAIQEIGTGVIVEAGNVEEITAALTDALNKNDDVPQSGKTLPMWGDRAKQLIKVLSGL